MFIMVIITVFISSFVDLHKQRSVKIEHRRKTNLQACFDLKSGSCLGCLLGSLSIGVEEPGVGNLGTVNTSACTRWVAFHKSLHLRENLGRNNYIHQTKGETGALQRNLAILRLPQGLQVPSHSLDHVPAPQVNAKCLRDKKSQGASESRLETSLIYPFPVEMFGAERVKLVLSWESWM